MDVCVRQQGPTGGDCKDFFEICTWEKAEFKFERGDGPPQLYFGVRLGRRWREEREVLRCSRYVTDAKLGAEQGAGSRVMFVSLRGAVEGRIRLLVRRLYKRRLAHRSAGVLGGVGNVPT